jgi:hypothetical protein
MALPLKKGGDSAGILSRLPGGGYLQHGKRNFAFFV